MSVASCKNTPKQIVKDAAITHLKMSGVENVNVLSIDSIEKWSTSDFKKICKKELETLQTLTTSAMSTLNNTYYTPEQQANVNRLTVVFTDSMQKYIPQLSVSYNNIDKHTDVTKYIYKVMYLANHKKVRGGRKIICCYLKCRREEENDGVRIMWQRK